MNYFPLDSGILKAYAWVPGEKTKHPIGMLAVVFKDGSEYWFQGVTERDFENFLTADSKGSFFRKIIEPRYPGKRKPVNE